MEAILVTRQNFLYVQEYVVKDAFWAVDFVKIFEENLANGEWTYVYTITRGAGERSKTFTYNMSEKKFETVFQFVSVKSPYSLTPITKK
jgi:hypothetical protein